MKKFLLTLVLSVFALPFSKAQSLSVFNDVPFYSMYHYLGEGQTLPPEAFSEIPQGAIRIHGYERDIISRKLTDAEIASLGNEITMNITLIAACDNYDRVAGVNLALVPKGLATYNWENTDVKRLEVGRFITPFMNKNKTPNTVPYTFTVNNLAKIIHDPVLMSAYDAWIEFRADGYSEAAQSQVPGCAGRTDVFRGTLELVSSGTPTIAETFLMPLTYRKNLNNYNATDVPGQTTKIVNFVLDQPVENMQLHLISSNHGANNGGEEYSRRNHFVYLDNELIYQYKPGGKSCEPFRQYNTQSNGIYGYSARTLRTWLSFSNWCPGEAIPIRQINLGNLAAGEHSIKIDVPDAVFVGGEGYFPISMYLQNAENGEIICKEPSNLTKTSQVGTEVGMSWQENGNATEWEVLWGRKNAYATSYDFYQTVTGTPETTRSGLTPNWTYEMYVKSKCTPEMESVWSGPLFTNMINLGTSEQSKINIQLYPNPANNFINVENASTGASYQIFSIDGKLMMSGKLDHSKINIQKLEKGLYIISVADKDAVSRVKFIKN